MVRILSMLIHGYKSETKSLHWEMYDLPTFQGHRKMIERLGPKKFPGLKWVDLDPFGL